MSQQQLPLGYKRKPVPTLGESPEVIKSFVADELQRIENTLALNGQETKVTQDGVTEVKQSVVNLTNTVGQNSAAITQEATTRVSEDSALAQLITNLTATVATGDNTNAAAISQEAVTRANEDSALAQLISNLSATSTAGDQTNAAAITAESTARSDADGALTKITQTQRALFGAASPDTWEATKQYNGSTATISGQTVATGDDVVFGTYIYRCLATHTNKQPPNTSYWQTVDTVDAKVSAAVQAETTARTSAGYAFSSDLTALSARVTNVENVSNNASAGVSTNAADIITVASTVATNESVQTSRNDTMAARFGVSVADNYDNTFSYSVGDEVVYNTNVYRCIQAATGVIPTNTTYWTFQTLLPGLTDARIYSAENTYATRNSALATDLNGLSSRVTATEGVANGAASQASVNAGDIATQSSTIATNAGVTSKRFDVVAARFGVSVSDTYDSNFTYAPGDEVVFNGNVYRCSTASTSNAPTHTGYWVLQELLEGLTDARIVVNENTYASRSTDLSSKKNSIEAKADDAHTAYGVALNSNGYITGFSQNNNGTSGTFKILADKFTIIDPAAAGSGLAGTQVFDITNGVVTMEAAFIKNLTTGNIVGDVNPTSAFSGSASKTFGPTTAGFVELMTVDCPASNPSKPHTPSINMVFDAAFATDTAYVKLEAAPVNGGSLGTYVHIQTLRHKTAAGGNSWTTIPVVGSLSNTTTQTTRFRVSIQMYSDSGTGTTNQSRSGTAHWSGTTTGIV